MPSRATLFLFIFIFTNLMSSCHSSQPFPLPTILPLSHVQEIDIAEFIRMMGYD